MLDPRQQKILDELKSYPSGAVYTIAPKEYVIRGFDYAVQRRVLGFQWNRAFSSLTAKVKGQRLYSVRFLVNKQKLNYSCNCPAWRPASNCEHVICVLMTVKSLFQPGAFGLRNHDESYSKSLLNGIYNNSPVSLKKQKADKYCIVIEKGDYEPDIYVRIADRRVYGYLHDLPKELKGVSVHPGYPYDIKSKSLADYLSRHGNKHPIIIKIGEQEIRVRYDESMQYTCKTEFNADRDNLRVTKLCRGEGGDNLSIIGDLIFNPNTKGMGVVRDNKGWQAWKIVDNELNFDDFNHSSFQIPLKRFQEAQILFPSDVYEDLIFKVDGKKSPLNKETHTYRLTVIPADNNGSFFLKAECILDNLKLTPSYGLFKFFVFLDHGAAPLRANKRRALLIRAFFDMISAGTKKQAEKVINDVLSEREFDRGSIRIDALRFLRQHLSIFFTAEQILRFHNRRWTAVAVNKAREMLLYRIPYEIFGWRIFKGMEGHDRMVVNADELYEHLLQLYERLKENNIEFYFKNKPVTTSSWDFSFDASKRSGIDWFEIKPEIMCNGEVVDESLWKGMLERKGVLEKDGYVEIMDSNARRILNIISTVFKTGNHLKRHSREIIRIPRLQILDWITLRQNGVKIKLSPEDEEIISRLNNFEQIERRPLPDRLRARLRPYQVEGYYWLAFLYEHRFGACLADDMGLGKTIQAISLLAGIKEDKVKSSSSNNRCPHLIVVPPSLLFNWENEIMKFYPAINIHLYTGTERIAKFDDCDVVLTTYGLVQRDIERLKDIQFDVIIFDEAQAIKNIYAQRTGAVRKLKGYFKLTMTGTPLENHMGEYYSIIDLTLPGLLGEYRKFKPLIKLSTSSSGLDLIIKRTAPFVLRRTKEKILKELPPKVETDIYLELTERQKALYKKTVEQVRSTIDDAYKTKTQEQAKIIALTAILKLRQICVSTRLLFPELQERSPKIEFLINRLKELLDEGHSALVFSQFTSFLDILQDDLKEERIEFMRLDGSTPIGKRKRLVEGFQAGNGPSVFLLSLKAGGQGLNLTKASYVFHLDPWWNPAVESQASDRAHRIGQKNKVTITRILMRHTIEEKMMVLKKQKLALYKAVVGHTSGKRQGVSLTKSDFDFLVSW